MSEPASTPCEGDRLAIGKREHRIAVAVVRQMRLNVGEAGEAGVADEVDLVGRDVEAVDRRRAPIGWEKTNMSSPLEPVRWSSPDQAKIGEPGA